MSNTPTFGQFVQGVAQLTKAGGYDEQRGGGATIEDEWTVVLADGDRPIASAVGVPAIGDAAASSGVLAKMFVSAIKWKQLADKSRVWVATVTYSRGSEKQGTQELPGAKYWGKQWGSRTVQRDLTADAVDGRAVVNSAGEPFDSVPQREMFCPVVSYTMLTTANPATVAAYQGTVNENAVTVLGITFAPHCARINIECRQLDPEEVEGIAKYEYQVTIEGATNLYSPTSPIDGTAPAVADVVDIGWDVSALDCGYCQRNGGALEPVLIEDGNGELKRPQSPVPLDGFGLYNPTDPDLHYHRFAAYPEADWPGYLTPDPQS